MNKNEVLFDKDLSKIKKGMETVHKAVVGTIGAAGRNVMFRDWSSEPVITNDGYTIAEMIKPEDQAESMGADFMKQAARRQNFEAGDGTTTVVALAYAMIEEGLKKIKDGVNAMKLKKQMESAVASIIEKLKKSAHKVKSDKELLDVATLSMEDSTMAQIVVDAVKNAGESGRVVVQESNGIGTTVEEVKGIEYSKGYLADVMITNPVKLTAEVIDVPIIVTDKEFNVMQQLLPFFEELMRRQQKYVVLLCKGLIGEAMLLVVNNIVQGNFFCCAVPLPEDNDVVEDICILTGAKRISEASSPQGLVPLHINDMGKAKRVIISREKTIIDSNEGQKKKILDRIKAIKTEIKEKEKTKDFVGRLQDRLAKLDGKVVYIKVGATTQQEMKYLKLKVDDAVASTNLAQKSGVVVGGGRALYDLGMEEPTNEGDEVVRVACMAPMEKIIENSKADATKILETLDKGQAYNVMTEKPVKDFIKEGIIDPVDIEIWALKNAVSTATGFLTSFAALVPVEPKKDK